MNRYIILIIALCFFIGASCYLYGRQENLTKLIKMQEQVEHYKTQWMPIKGGKK